ncbi:MAG TPA: bacterial type II secretion system protein F domain protein [Cyanobacteria bacterium UBA8803]|nr:bacterial type II secretion system protein F domain protein [Cyanobacteria bacterium UBA9273]HBL59296.1 bacterial type II secretion system protein F domain protein [Cyanobacteria bacterium UBA8803]
MPLLNSLTIRQKAHFFSQFATLLNSGLTVQQSLTLAGKGCPLSCQHYLQQASLAVGNGQELASALALESHYFDNWTIALIRLAEYSGSLPQALQMLARETEARGRQQKLYRSVRFSAIATIWAVLVLTAAIFNPHATGLVKPEFWVRSIAIACLLLAIAFLMPRFSSPIWQPLVSNLPIVGKLLEARSLLYLAQLRLPLSCGVPILTALELLREHIPDLKMRTHLTKTVRRVRIGQPLSQSLQGKLPPVAMQIIATGEETGNLDSALENLARYYQEQLERGLQMLQTILRPLSLIALGSLVAVVGVRGLSVLLNSLPD